MGSRARRRRRSYRRYVEHRLRGKSRPDRTKEGYTGFCDEIESLEYFAVQRAFVVRRFRPLRRWSNVATLWKRSVPLTPAGAVN